MLCNKRNHRNEKHAHSKEEESQLATTGENLFMATRRTVAKNKINKQANLGGGGRNTQGDWPQAGGGSLLAKSCPTLVTPCTIACQAPLSMDSRLVQFSSVQSLSRVQLFGVESQLARPPCPSQTPGEFTQTHAHWVSDNIQPSHPLASPSPPAPNPSQH